MDISANDPRIASPVTSAAAPSTTTGPAAGATQSAPAGNAPRDSFQSDPIGGALNRGNARAGARSDLVNGQLAFKDKLLAGNYRATGWLSFWKELRQIWKTN